MQAILLTILPFLLLLVGLQAPLIFDNLPLYDRLLPNFHGNGYNGRDVYALIAGQQWLFWRNTGETPESFLDLVNQLTPFLSRLNVHGQPRQRQRRQTLNLTNQVLLVFIWLRKYPHIDTLALWFDIDPSSIMRIIYKILPELWRYFHNQIRWLNDQEWANLMGNWPEFPNVVGCIDSTPHEIYRPYTEPQRPFYSGHRHYHCFNTQLIIDNEGHLRFVQTGFLGSTHDSTSYRLMTPVGNGRQLSMPPGAKLLADQGYPDDDTLLTPVRPVQMRILTNRERRRARNFNTHLASRRIKIEHVFKDMKSYKAIGNIWRHPRWLMPICIELVAFLAERRVRLFDNI